MIAGEGAANGAAANRQPTITLDELALDSQRIGELTHAEASALLLRASALSLALSTRLAATIADSPNTANAPAPDRLLDVDQAGKLLGMAPATLYRNKDRYPFFVRNGRTVRFSANGIEKWIGRRMKMSLQTSAKIMVVVLILASAIAGGAARAQSTGELTQGMKSEPGWFAIEIPPIQVVDGRRVVMVSAPEAEWNVTNLGPFLDMQDCSRALSQYSRGSLLDSDYQAFKAGRPFSVDAARVLADVQARNARCESSDGSDRYRTAPRFTTDPTTDFVK